MQVAAAAAGFSDATLKAMTTGMPSYYATISAPPTAIQRARASIVDLFAGGAQTRAADPPQPPKAAQSQAQLPSSSSIVSISASSAAGGVSASAAAQGAGAGRDRDRDRDGAKSSSSSTPKASSGQATPSQLAPNPLSPAPVAGPFAGKRGGASASAASALLTAPLPPPHRGGCVILSEFSTATSVLNSNLVVNPWNIRLVAREIDKALLMEDHERSFRQWRDYQYAIRNPAATWSRNCISDVVEIRAERGKQQMLLRGEHGAADAATPQPAAGASSDAASAALMSLQAAVEVERSPVPLLDVAAVVRAFGAARRALLVFDYGGTLVSRSHVVGEAAGRHGFQLADGYAEHLPADVLLALGRLAADSRAATYIVSGLRSGALQALPVATVPRLGLAAENGFVVSHPAGAAGAAGAARAWESLSPADAERMAGWRAVKQQAVAIMTDYTWRVNGSVVQEYDSMVAWDFRDADSEWASAQARFVAQELEQRALAESPLDAKVTVTKIRVEVCLRGVDKGRVVAETLRRLGPGAAPAPVPVDFVLCVGDDTTDEDMFAAVSAWAATARAGADTGAGAPAVFTATVGKKKATSAASWVADVAGVHELVRALAECADPTAPR
jgi:trehalose 6-phosphate synthase/phosphatase